MEVTGEDKSNYWEKKWEDGLTSWHRNEVDRRLMKYLGELTSTRSGVRVLVTWCGKSVDIPWLCKEGYEVVGVELSEIAVKQMFDESNIPYTVNRQDSFLVYQGTDRRIAVYVGNYYELTPAIVGVFEAIWDHHALGASEPKDRLAYKQVLVSLLRPHGKILLSHFEYGNQIRNQAPYSISQEMIKDLFEDKFDIKYLENATEFVELVKSIFSFDWVKHPINLLTLK